MPGIETALDRICLAALRAACDRVEAGLRDNDSFQVDQALDDLRSVSAQMTSYLQCRWRTSIAVATLHKGESR